MRPHLIAVAGGLMSSALFLAGYVVGRMTASDAPLLPPAGNIDTYHWLQSPRTNVVTVVAGTKPGRHRVLDEPDDRDRADAAFVERRRAGQIMWDDLSANDRAAVHNVVMLYRIDNDLSMGQLHPNLVGLRAIDRPLLDEFSALAMGERAAMSTFEVAFAPLLADARIGKANPDHYELLTTRVKASDPRLVNGIGLFFVRWQMNRKVPGYYEPGPHRVDDAIGEVEVGMHWVKPAAHPDLAARATQMIESQTRRRELAAILFPRLYHEVK